MTTRLEQQHCHRTHFKCLFLVSDAISGRVSQEVVQAVFGEWKHDSGAVPRFIVAGTKPMKKDVYAHLASLGWPKNETMLLHNFYLPRIE